MGVLSDSCSLAMYKERWFLGDRAMKKPVLFPLKRYMFENKKLLFCNRLLFISFVIFGFYGTFNIAAYGKITRLYPTDDGYVYENPPVGSGSSNILWVGYSTTYGNFRSCLKFDISTIPLGSVINSATLRCHYHWYLTGGTSDSRSISAHRADQYWHEGSMQWPGGGFAESYGSDSAGGGYQKWCSWNVTTLVQHWMDGTYPNYGITLKSTSEGGTGTNVLGFESKEDGSNTPYLEIDYTPPTHARGGELIAWGADNFVGDGDDFVDVDSSVACGPGTIVALRADGSLWGYNSDVPDGNDYIAIAGACFAGYAIRSDGSLISWGGCISDLCNVPSGNDYVAVTGGGSGYYGLALRSDGTIACWGNKYVYGDCFGMCLDKPSGSFVAIDAGSCHNLALRSSGTVVAWGNNYFDQCNVPSGTYVAIGAGRAHSVGLRTDGSIVCWGNNSYGQCNAPSGNNFVAISVGDDHNIAQRADGSLVAWGNNSQGQCDMPVGSDFIAFCAGGDTSLVIVREPTSIYRSGSAVNQWAEDSPASSLEDSIFERGIVLGNGIDPATPIYFFYLPEKTTPAGQIEWISVSIDGDNAWLSWPEAYIGTDSNPISLRDSGTTTYTRSGAAARNLLVDANDNVGSLLTVQIDVGSWTDRYDLNDIVITYLYSGADYDTLSNFQMAYCGYRAINNFKTDIVEETWGLDGTISEEIINNAVQRTGAFCQNLMGLDGNIFQAVKSFFDSLAAFQNLANLIYDYADFTVFWGSWYGNGTYPSLDTITDDCNTAATACADLAIIYRDLAFDGIDDSECEQILDEINNAKVELEALKSTLQSAASHMNNEYQSGGLGSQSAKLSKQSMSPMMRYEPNSMTLYDSYLPNVIADINEQANQFVTVDFDISPSDKGLYFTVDGDPCDSHRTFVWLTGHSHTLGAPLTQTGGDGYVYEFDSWTDGGNSTHEIMPMSDETYIVTYTVDNQPPTPDPMSWENEPCAISSTAITMVATSASDPQGNGVEYYFEETSGNPGGSDSGWQDSSTYTDYDLLPNTTYAYTVKARDKSLNAELNVTAPSSPPASAKTYQIGDFDHSRINDWADLDTFVDYWLYSCSGPDWCNERDIDKSTSVNLADFAEFAVHWFEDNTL